MKDKEWRELHVNQRMFNGWKKSIDVMLAENPITGTSINGTVAHNFEMSDVYIHPKEEEIHITLKQTLAKRIISINMHQMRMEKLIGTIKCEIDHLDKEVEGLAQGEPYTHRYAKNLIRGEIDGYKRVLHFIDTMGDD